MKRQVKGEGGDEMKWEKGKKRVESNGKGKEKGENDIIRQGEETERKKEKG